MARTKINLKDLHKKFNQNMKQVIDDLTRSSRLQPLANDLTKDIKVRTRLGYGVNATGKKRRKLIPLKLSTIAKRQSIKNFLSGETNPKRSNLTEIGKMLDSLKGTAKNKQIEIKITNKQREKVATKHHKGDRKRNLPPRPFMYLSNLELKRFQKSINTIVKKLLVKYF